MPQRRLAPLGPVSFVLSLAALALLPIVPEAYLCLRGHGDLKAFAPICYYEAIVSFLLVIPALIPFRPWSRAWVLVVGSLMAVATLAVGFQAVTVGARWDLTAHAALMQTSPGEAMGFVRSFATPANVIWMGLLAAGFAASIAVNLLSPMPRCRVLAAILAVGALASAYGLFHFYRYGRHILRVVPVSSGESLTIAGVSVNVFHPVTVLWATDHNYRATHAYYLRVFRDVSAHVEQFKGAVPVKGAAVPRVVVVVIGESASRRHWSLYGYARDTTPELRKLGAEVLLFSDVISPSVGTQTVLRRMFSAEATSVPIFPFFSAAGFRTHWLSAQYNQGENDVEVAALVQSCEHRLFLDGAYDENLLPFLADAVSSPGRQMVFVDLLGSHVRYEDRYPSSFSRFRGTTDKERLIATYDNSIAYTDHVLAEMIETLRQRHEVSCLVYVSDHAEDVYDSTPDAYLFRNDAIATNAMYEVPFIVWFSPEYRRANPEFVRGVEAATDRAYQTVAFYQSVIDLARLTHPLLDPRLSVFSPDFREVARHVGVSGRTYRRGN